MFWFFITFFLLGIAIAAFFVGRSVYKEADIRYEAWKVRQESNDPSRASYSRDSEPMPPHIVKVTARSISIGAFALWLLITFFTSVETVEAGHVGVVYQFGSIEGQITEGLQFIAPWQSVVTADIRVQRARFAKMSAASSETQDVFITATLNYSVSPNAIQNLYRSVGVNWFDRLVEARVLNYFKQETVNYTTVAVLPNREVIRSNVRDQLEDSLAPYSITVVDLLIENISFNPGFTQAIEDKQIATQNALREKENIKVAEAQADQAVATAVGEADAIRARAQGQADANRALNASLTPELIQYTAIQNLSDNVQLVLVPQSGNFLFNLGTALNGPLANVGG